MASNVQFSHVPGKFWVGESCVQWGNTLELEESNEKIEVPMEMERSIRLISDRNERKEETMGDNIVVQEVVVK